MDFPAPAFSKSVQTPARDTLGRDLKEQMDRLAARLDLEASTVDPVSVMTEEEARNRFGRPKGTSKLAARARATATASALQAPSTAKMRGSMVQKEMEAAPPDAEKARLAQTFAPIDDEAAGETKGAKDHALGTEADRAHGDKHNGGNKFTRLFKREKKREK